MLVIVVFGRCMEPKVSLGGGVVFLWGHRVSPGTHSSAGAKRRWARVPIIHTHFSCSCRLPCLARTWVPEMWNLRWEGPAKIGRPWVTPGKVSRSGGGWLKTDMYCSVLIFTFFLGEGCTTTDYYSDWSTATVLVKAGLQTLISAANDMVLPQQRFCPVWYTHYI